MKSSLSLLIALCLAACTQTPPRAAPSCFHLSEAAEVKVGYCQAIRIDNRLYISGTAGQGEMPEAVQSVYERLKKTLEQNGLTFKNVVKENVYTTDLDRFKQSAELRQRYYGDSLPAATWVQVQRLYVPSLVVEIELVADYPQ